MKRIQLIGLGFSLLCLWVILSSSSAGRATAANTGNTGGPGETATCGSCHTGGSYGTVSLQIQLFSSGTTNAVTSYTAGTLYDLRVTVNHTAGTPAGYGFQLTTFRQTGNTPLADTYSNLGSNVKKKTVTTGTYSGRTYCEHNGVTNNNVFNMSWTAPAAGTGTVVFYAAGNAVNGANGDNLDKAGNTSLTITEAAALSATGTVTNVNCNGGTNGAIDLTPAGGASGYTYHWNTNATTQDLSGLAAGSYSVTVTDAASATTTASFTVTQPAALTLNATPGTILCNGGTTTVTLSANGGTPSYTYSGSTTNLSAGNYNYTVTDSKGCTANTSVSITQPTALQVSTNSSLAASCFGGSVNIVVNASGGTPPYSGTGTFSATAGPHTYTVTDANNCSKQLSVTVTQPAQLTASATNDTIPCTGGNATVVVTANGGTAPYNGTGTFTLTTPGSYTYTITDANNCSTTATATVSSVNGFTATASPAPLACQGSCTGAIDVSISGGAAPFTYSWNTGATTQDLNNLCAGSYQQTITDNNGCLSTNSYVITEPAALVLNVAADSIKCFGETAQITLTASGGTSPYTFTGGGVLTAGTYNLSVSDANSCNASQSYTLTEPAQLSASTNVQGSTGSNGSVTATPTGGTAPYSYSWSNTETTQTISNLAPGTYDLTVTDANGCTYTTQGIEVPLVNGMSETGMAAISIYPNPADENLNIALPESIKEGKLMIMDVHGNEVFSQYIHAQNQFQISLIDFATGVYWIGVKSSVNYSTRFIKQ